MYQIVLPLFSFVILDTMTKRREFCNVGVHFFNFMHCASLGAPLLRYLFVTMAAIKLLQSSLHIHFGTRLNHQVLIPSFVHHIVSLKKKRAQAMAGLFALLTIETGASLFTPGSVSVSLSATVTY